MHNVHILNDRRVIAAAREERFAEHMEDYGKEDGVVYMQTQRRRPFWPSAVLILSLGLVAISIIMLADVVTIVMDMR